MEKPSPRRIENVFERPNNSLKPLLAMEHGRQAKINLDHYREDLSAEVWAGASGIAYHIYSLHAFDLRLGWGFRQGHISRNFPWQGRGEGHLSPQST